MFTIPCRVLATTSGLVIILHLSKDNMTDDARTRDSKTDGQQKERKLKYAENRFAPYRETSSRQPCENRIFVQNLSYAVESQELKKLMEEGNIALTQFSSHKWKELTINWYNCRIWV